jgi:glycosyltransferase 2 family protein
MPTPSLREDPPEQSRLERAGHLAARVSSLEPADPNLRRGLHAAIGIIVVLGVALAVVAAVGDFPKVDWRFRPLGLILAVVGLSIFLVAAAEIWRRLLGVLGHRLNPLRAQGIWFTSSLGRYVPTSLLLPMLRVAMCGRDGVPGRISMASVVYEFSLFLAANLAVAAYFIVTLPQLAGDWERWVVVAIPFIALVVLQPRIFHRFADASLERLGRGRLPLSLPGRRLIEFAALYVLDLLLAGLATYCLAQSVYPVGADDLPTVVGSFAVGTGLSIIAFVIPGGLGAREAGMALALSSVMPTAPAVAIAVLSLLLQLGLEVTLALATLFLLRRGGGADREPLAEGA